jgi:hypothetical protein
VVAEIFGFIGLRKLNIIDLNRWAATEMAEEKETSSFLYIAAWVFSLQNYIAL